MSPYQNGIVAHQSGLTLNDNPYLFPASCHNYFEWERGFMASAADFYLD